MFVVLFCYGVIAFENCFRALDARGLLDSAPIQISEVVKRFADAAEILEQREEGAAHQGFALTQARPYVARQHQRRHRSDDQGGDAPLNFVDDVGPLEQWESCV